MKYIEMCYYAAPPSPGGQIPTNNQALEPRFPLVYGIQDDLMLDAIEWKATTARMFEWKMTFTKMNGGALAIGDVKEIVVKTSIGDQDSSPRSLNAFGVSLEKNIERINTDLINFGKTELTFEVSAEAPVEGDAEPLWNCTCFTDTSIAVETP